MTPTTFPLVSIALPLPLDQPFTYTWPETLVSAPAVGWRVLVPLGRRKVAGYVVRTDPERSGRPPGSGDRIRYKEVISLLDEEPLFGEKELRFYEWISQYYLVALGEVLRTALPVSMHQKSYKAVRILPHPDATAKQELFLSEGESQILSILKSRDHITIKDLQKKTEKTGLSLGRYLHGLEEKGMVEICQVFKGKQFRDTELIRNQGRPCSRTPAPTLTDEQEAVMDAILPHLDEPAFHPFLLHGVTGSGKTEVYIRVIEKVLERGKEALVLVPEIALTPQTVESFSSRLETDIAVIHSRLTQKERLDCWWKIRRGQVRIAIGARSAIFAPFQNLGVVVVDEEHDPSFKQQDRVRYNGRDLAMVRGTQEQAIVILGSATPSLESYHNSLKGKSTLLKLTERVEGRPFPQIRPINMKNNHGRKARQNSVSAPLEKALRENLKRDKRSLLFLNRRGYSHTLICRDCGHLFRCPNCSVSLTFHRGNKRLCCHYCEFHQPPPSRCPACQGTDIQPVGRGTERIEEEIRELVPKASVGRMDRDTTRKKGSHEQILQQFKRGDLDTLIGTQMIAKGHDIPEVTLVGVILADVSLDLPDFRASERTFQLLLQVAGRAGRGPWPGEVLIQTYHPEHYSIQSVSLQDYEKFYDQELAFRKELNYPPFSRMINLRVTGTDEGMTKAAAHRIGKIARSLQENRPADYHSIEILGPSQAPLARLRGRFRHHCFLKGNPPRLLLAFTREIISRSKTSFSSGKVKLEVDVDPVQVL